MSPRVRLPRERMMLTLEVRRCQPVSAGFTTVTLGGPGIRHLVPGEADQAVRPFFPREGQHALRMPTASNEAWMVQVLRMPKETRPWVRTLTVRSLRPAEQELDIEFALHGDSPMTSWVRRVQPGDPAGIFDLGSMYGPPEHTRGRLLVGDETALPAILSILDRDPNPSPTEVFVEVATKHDIRAVPTHPGGRVHWLSRDSESLRPGVRALEAVAGAELPEGPLYAWAAGEAKLATGVRRHLVNDRGIPKRDVSFYGYWRLGRSAPG